MRTITVKLSAIGKVVKTARQMFPDSNDWQAELCEIALLPKVYKRWREYNEANDRPAPILERVTDANYWGPGYVLYWSRGWRWNSVSDGPERGYSHSPSTAWNGIRRETYGVYFLEALRMLYHSAVSPEIRVGAGLFDDCLNKAKIRVVNDLEGDNG